MAEDISSGLTRRRAANTSKAVPGSGGGAGKAALPPVSPPLQSRRHDRRLTGPAPPHAGGDRGGNPRAAPPRRAALRLPAGRGGGRRGAGRGPPRRAAHPRSPDALALLHQAGGGGGHRPALGARPARAGRSGGAGTSPSSRPTARRGSPSAISSPTPAASACSTPAGPQRSWEEIVARDLRHEARSRAGCPGEKAGYHHASSWFILGEVSAPGRPALRPLRPRGDLRAAGDGGLLDRHAPPSATGLTGEPAGSARCGTPRGSRAERPRLGHGGALRRAPAPGGNGYGPMRELGRFYEMLLGRGILGTAAGSSRRRRSRR